MYHIQRNKAIHTIWYSIPYQTQTYHQEQIHLWEHCKLHKSNQLFYWEKHNTSKMMYMIEGEVKGNDAVFFLSYFPEHEKFVLPFFFDCLQGDIMTTKEEYIQERDMLVQEAESGFDSIHTFYNSDTFFVRKNSNQSIDSYEALHTLNTNLTQYGSVFFFGNDPAGVQKYDTRKTKYPAYMPPKNEILSNGSTYILFGRIDTLRYEELCNAYFSYYTIWHCLQDIIREDMMSDYGVETNARIQTGGLEYYYTLSETIEKDTIHKLVIDKIQKDWDLYYTRTRVMMYDFGDQHDISVTPDCAYLFDSLQTWTTIADTIGKQDKDVLQKNMHQTVEKLFFL